MKKTRQQIGRMSKNKGKGGELELAHKFTEYGLDAERSVQYRGRSDSADIQFKGACTELNGIFHVECKRVETLNIEQALQQAEKDVELKTTMMPVVAHRKNQETWKITLRLSDFAELAKAWFERGQW